MGNYHPHGDSAIMMPCAPAVMVVAAGYPLVAGQGNFGTPATWPVPALQRMRTGAPRHGDRRDIDEESCRFPEDNRVGKNQEPTILPSRFPEPARQRLRRYRGRHGDEDPAP